jgi:hypothetical protein
MPVRAAIVPSTGSDLDRVAAAVIAFVGGHGVTTVPAISGRDFGRR